MEHKKILEDLNRQKVEKIDEYLKTKKNIPPEHQTLLDRAKEKWQEAWAKYLDTIMYLETFEL